MAERVFQLKNPIAVRTARDINISGTVLPAQTNVTVVRASVDYRDVGIIVTDPENEKRVVLRADDRRLPKTAFIFGRREEASFRLQVAEA